MKILVVGSGAREHALCWKVSKSPLVKEVFCVPGNAGIAKIAKCHAIDDQKNTNDQIVAFALENQVDLTIVGNEQYLVEGLADALRQKEQLVVGPSEAAAKIEGDKCFAKSFMQKNQIPTANFQSFQSHQVSQAIEYLSTIQAPYVIKASGLAAGKGVITCHDQAEASRTIEDMLSGKLFGDAGRSIVIEEFLEGEEVSYFVISDGKSFISLPNSQDHKSIGELSTGSNTGGMGAYSPAPVVTNEVEQRILDQIVEPTIEGMAKEGSEYQGVLYIGLMIQDGNPKVIEFNCRFGDPECQAMMMRFKSDIVPLFVDAAKGALADHDYSPELHGASACVVLASEGYPEAYKKGDVISGLEQIHNESVEVFHAGTIADGEAFRVNGGRVLSVTTHSNTLEHALNCVYAQVAKIHWNGKTYRRDIGLKGLVHEKNHPEVCVGLLAGSHSDLGIVKKATAILKRFDISYRVIVASAHRSPDRVAKFMQDCENAGAGVFIAFAGMAAHLPGVVASQTTLPVIGVPICSSMDGNDALLSIAQMPPGVPVATVAIDGGGNAGILATQILAAKYTDLRAKLKIHKIDMEHQVAINHKKAGADDI